MYKKSGGIISMKKFLFLLAVVISTGFIACEDTNGAGNSKAASCAIAFDANGGSGGRRRR
jgi:hypothetical protein